MKKKFIKTPLVGVQVHGAKDVGTRTVNLLMGEHAGEYVRGDIMDANAVIQAFDELKGNVDNNHDSLEEIVNEIHNFRDTTNHRFDTVQEKAEEETANRIQGDKTLDEKIDQKERESKERDNVLQQNIDTEKQERINADTELRNDLNTEITRATTKENEIETVVNTINGSSTTEGSFRKAIADVVGAAPEAYDTLKEIADKLNSNDSLHKTIESAIAEKATTAALEGEIARAKAAEIGIKNELGNKADVTDLETLEQKVNANTAAIDTKQPKGNYLTEHQSLEEYAKKAELPTVPTKVSQLTNDSNFITAATADQQYVTFEQALQGFSAKQDKIVPGEVDILSLNYVNDIDGLKNIVRQLMNTLKEIGLIKQSLPA